MNKYICSSYKAGKSLTFLGDGEIIWTRIFDGLFHFEPHPARQNRQTVSMRGPWLYGPKTCSLIIAFILI